MKSKKDKHINLRERMSAVVYVLLFFCSGVACSVWLLLRESDVSGIFSRKDGVQLKIERRQSFRKAQAEGTVVCDLLVKRISTYDAGVNASYEKNDIQYIINELRGWYENNRHDKRYLAFMHLGDFYQLWFNDRQYLWSLKSNLDYLKNNLEECELGLERRRGEGRGNR